MTSSEEKQPLLGKNTVLSGHGSKALEGKIPIFAFKRRRLNKELQRFYERQQDLEQKYEEDRKHVKTMQDVADHRADVENPQDFDAKKRQGDMVLAKVSFFCNLLLLIGKAVVAYLSNSLSVISSVVDSAVDITSGVVIWMTAKKIDHPDPYSYPRGRPKLEPLAVVMVAIIMAVASLQIIIQSVQSIVEGKVDPDVGIPTIATMGAAIAVKFVLMVVCWRHGSVSTRVLAIDHRNDCVSNTVAIVCGFLGAQYWRFIDPIGAILVAIYIIVTWYFTGVEQIPLLSGKTAQPEFLNRIIKLCIEHDPRIMQLETIYVYHYGSKYLVEAHIVLNQDMPLKTSHDISESLQITLEHLPFVERAFIHCDYGPDSCICACGKEH